MYSKTNQKSRTNKLAEFYARPRKTKVRRARDIQVDNGVDKAVWMNVCDHAGNKDGGICTADLETIVCETLFARSTVIESLNTLEEQGRITARRVGRHVHRIVHIPQGDTSAIRTEQVRNTDSQVRNTDPLGPQYGPISGENLTQGTDAKPVSDADDRSKASESFTKEERKENAPSARVSLVSRKKKVGPHASSMPDSWKPSQSTIQYGINKRGFTEEEATAVLAKLKTHYTTKRADKRSCDWQVDARQWLDSERLPANGSIIPLKPEEKRRFVEVDSLEWKALLPKWREEHNGDDPPQDDLKQKDGRHKRGWEFYEVFLASVGYEPQNLAA